MISLAYFLCPNKTNKKYRYLRTMLHWHFITSDTPWDFYSKCKFHFKEWSLYVSTALCMVLISFNYIWNTLIQGPRTNFSSWIYVIHFLKQMLQFWIIIIYLFIASCIGTRLEVWVLTTTWVSLKEGLPCVWVPCSMSTML